MKRLRRLLRRLSSFILWRRSESDLADELEHHIDLQTRDNIRQGMTSEEARRAAVLKFGGIDSIKESYRSQRGLPALEDLFSDLLYAFRQLRQIPGFTLTVVVTLALGIGANTALFSVVNALLLRSLPFRDADRLVYISEIWPHEPPIRFPPSPDFNKWRLRGKTFERLEAYGGGGVLTLTGIGEPERVPGTQVTAGLLEMLGVHPLFGRNFLPEEDRTGGPAAVILGNNFWHRRFAGDPDIVRRTIELNGQARTVVGVLPDSFIFPDNGFSDDILTPMRLTPDPDWHENTFGFLRALARVKTGVKPEALRSEFAAIVQSGANQEPPQFITMRKNMQVVVTPLRTWLSGDVTPFLLILQAAAMLVSLTGCLNVANIQIARSISRQKEMALRASLGAGRSRLIRQLLTESLLLSAIGSGAGLLAGYVSLRYLRFLLPQHIHLMETVQFDSVVLLFALGVSIVTGISTGLTPALAACRSNLRETIERDSGRATAGGHQRFRSLLVIAQVAVAMVLVVGSGLLVRSFWRLASVSLGFEPRGVVTLRVPLVGQKYAAAASRKAFTMELLERARHIPGVRDAALGDGLPLIGALAAGVVVEDQPPPPPGGAPTIPATGVSPSYFRTVGIPLFRGRLLSEDDREDTPLVAVVNQAFATRFFPAGNAIGKHLKFGSVVPGPWIEIVGIVGNVRQHGLLLEDEPNIYSSYGQGPSAIQDTVLVLKTDSDPSSTIAAATRLIHSIDPAMPVYDIATMEERVDAALSDQRASMVAMGISGGLSLVLASTGIFGVIAYLVSRREKEFGIRVALGAQSRDILCLVLKNGLVLTGIGIAVGLIASLLATKVLTKFLYEIAPDDPVTLIAATALFTAVAMTACYIPAHRAARADPIRIWHREQT